MIPPELGAKGEKFLPPHVIQIQTCFQSFILHDYFYNILLPAEPGVDRQSATEAFNPLH